MLTPEQNQKEEEALSPLCEDIASAFSKEIAIHVANLMAEDISRSPMDALTIAIENALSTELGSNIKIAFV